MKIWVVLSKQWRRAGNKKHWQLASPKFKTDNIWQCPALTAGRVSSPWLTPLLSLSLAEQGVGSWAGGARPQGHGPEQGGIWGEESSCAGGRGYEEQRFVQQEPANVSELLTKPTVLTEVWSGRQIHTNHQSDARISEGSVILWKWSLAVLKSECGRWILESISHCGWEKKSYSSGFSPSVLVFCGSWCWLLFQCERMIF